MDAQAYHDELNRINQLQRQREAELGRGLTGRERAMLRYDPSFTSPNAATDQQYREEFDNAGAVRWTREAVSDISQMSPGQVARSAAAGVVTLPGAVPTIAGLAGNAIAAGYDAATDTQSRPFMDRFAEARYGVEGAATLRQAQEAFIARYREANPNATNEQVRVALDDYTKSSEYDTLEKSQLGIVSRVGAEITDAGNRLVGAPNERAKNRGEQLLGSVAGAVVPTGVLVRGAGLTGGQALAANLLLPGASGHSAANLALNAAAGAAVPALVGGVVDAPELPEDRYDDERVQSASRALADGTAMIAQGPVTERDPVLLQAAGGVAAAGAISVLAAIGLRRPSVANAITPNVVPTPPSGNNIATTGARLLDETAPIQEALTRAGATREQATTAIREATGLLDAQDHLADFARTGRSPYLTTPTQRFDIITQKAERFSSTGELEDIERALAYQSALDSRNYRFDFLSRQEVDLHKQLAEASTELTRKQAANQGLVRGDRFNIQEDATRLSNITRQLDETRDELARLKADDVSVRNHFPDQSLNDLQTHINTVRSNPEVAKFMDEVVDGFRANGEMLVNAGIWSKADFDELSKTHKNYVPLRHLQEELQDGGLKGILNRAKLNYAEGGAKGEENIAGLQPGRRANTVELQDRIGFNGGKLASIVDELASRHRVATHQIALNNYRRFTIQEMVNTGDAVARKVMPNGSNVLSPKSDFATDILKKDGVVYFMKDGNYHVYTIRNDALARAVMRMPDEFGLFTRIAKQASSLQREGTTGLLNPIFHATANPFYDLGSIFMVRGLDNTIGTANYLQRAGLNKTGNALDKAMRATGAQIIDPGVWLPVAVNSVRLAGANIAGRLATKIERELAANFGAFNTIAGKSPTVRAMFHGIARRLTDVIEEAHVANYYRLTGQTPPFMQDAARYTREVEGVLTHTRQLAGTKNSIPVQALVGIKDLMKDVVWGISNAPRFSYYVSQVAAKTAKKGSPLTDRELKAIAGDARTITGDLRKRSDAKIVRTVDQHTMYLNVALQANREVYNRLLSDPRILGFAMSSVLVPSYFSIMALNSNPELSRWYNSEVPDWRKDSHLYVPNVQGWNKIMQSFANTGGWPTNLNKDDFTALLQGPDFRPLRGAIRTTLESLGVDSRYRPTTVPTTTPWDIAKTALGGLIQSFTPGFPGYVQLGVQQTMDRQLNSFRFGEALFDDRKSFAENLAPPARSRENFTDVSRIPGAPTELNSAFSRGTMQMLGIVLGTFGRNLADTLDTGEKMNRQGNSLATSFFAAGEDLAQRMTEPRSDYPMVQIMRDRVFFNNPMREQYDKYRHDIGLAIRPIPNSRQPSYAGNPLRDPVLETVRQNIEAFTRRDPDYKAITQDIRAQENSIRLYTANKNISYNERQENIARIRRNLIDLYERANIRIDQLENALRAGQVGQSFEAVHGRRFTLENWRAKADAAYQANQFDSRPPSQRR